MDRRSVHRSLWSYWHAMLLLGGLLLMTVGTTLWAAGQRPLGPQVFVAGCACALAWLGIAAYDSWQNRP